MRRRLASSSEEDLAVKSSAIVRAIEASSAWSRAEVVLAFLPLPGEADLRSLIADSLAAGKTVGLPRIDGEDIVFHAVTGAGPATGLVRHAYGMLEPQREAPMLKQEGLAGRKVLVLVPGLAFDRRGGRVGRGKGFYDRFLGALRSARLGRRGESPPPSLREDPEDSGCGFIALGVGFSCQLVDEVPTGAEDFRLDGVVTEEGGARARPSETAD